ncbi:unnamed protein product, partial [Allacma fusca]
KGYRSIDRFLYLHKGTSNHGSARTSQKTPFLEVVGT